MKGIDSNSKAVSEEELVRLAQRGDAGAEETLIRKYKGTIKAKGRLYYIAGADRDDIVQEGMIGIFKAIRGFDESKQTSFRTFAELCINRQIITAIKQAARMKHSPLNTSLSLNRPMSEDEKSSTLGETLSSGSNTDPVALLLLKEAMDIIEGNEKNLLSDLEYKVWGLYRKGKSYVEISEILGKSKKSIDNTIQRTRRKLSLYIEESNKNP